MIQRFDINRIFPRFILQDVNGLAMAKAIEAGLNYFLTRAQSGLDTLQNVDEMPEWRLDELAREYNCLYDYSADVDIKREWIRDAVKNYQLHGTAEGVRQYLKTYFGESSVDEFWEFGGDPGEFNVTVAGLRSDENEAWIRKACEKAKNVRSVLNNIVFNGGQSDCAVQTAVAEIGVAVVIDSVMYD
ncbi:MAG: hypothetical protein IJK98_11930 [Clostridia bacterium]|nr:hypothetical protein [Clostridia bacterium]